jgi:uracil-DNA glycosylase
VLQPLQVISTLHSKAGSDLSAARNADRRRIRQGKEDIPNEESGCRNPVISRRRIVPLCPRLFEFRQQNRRSFPDFFNNPVPSFGAIDAPLLIVGLAPGLKGQSHGPSFHRRLRGRLLVRSLQRHGLARGEYLARPMTGFELVGVRITNAVRCVPPENKARPCRDTTPAGQISRRRKSRPCRNLRAILALGQIAHTSVIQTLNLKRKTALWPWRPSRAQRV